MLEFELNKDRNEFEVFLFIQKNAYKKRPCELNNCQTLY